MIENMNLGIAKAIISNKITNEFINESTIDKSKNLTSKFINLIKKTPSLMIEYVIINNIENKYISNDILASKYIDENLNLFNDNSNGIITKKIIKEGHLKLSKFIGEYDHNIISETKNKLYNSINTLILEGINSRGDINKVHNAYSYVLNYLKENIIQVDENKSLNKSLNINENLELDSIVKLATKKFNEKFSDLNENDISLLNNIVYGSKEDKKALFESLKIENIKSLNSTESNGVEDKIHEAIERLNNMDYTEDDVSENIIKLHNLKENLN